MPVEATHARIRLIGGGFDRNIVEDIAIPQGDTAILQLKVPVGTYEVYVIAYRQYSDSHGNKYGTALTGNTQKGLVVNEGNTTSVSMTLEKFGLTATDPPVMLEREPNVKFGIIEQESMGLTFQMEATVIDF